MKGETVHIALIGGGPSALFMYKRLTESPLNISVTIFEKSARLGAGMPYSQSGAGDEHITNVSSNEIPELPVSPHEWLKTRAEVLGDSSCADYSPYKVFPRRLFGDYLEDQFHLLIEKGRGAGIKTEVLLNTGVSDIQYANEKVSLFTEHGKVYNFDKAVVCTGHKFPTGVDEASTGCYQSPYPPQKLSVTLNHAVALRGASLTAVDAIKTLARANGAFVKGSDGSLSYSLNSHSPDFKMVLHCRSGMLPAVRFHLADSRLKNPSLLTSEQIESHKNKNGGFLSLDYIFEKDFKEPLKASDPDFYQKIKDYTMEEFVHAMLQRREGVNPFTLLKIEYDEADRSIKRKESICWKEMLGVLSFALNYPAKYFSAEDMIRYKHTLHPLISLVIAYLPQSSCRELLALHEAGCLEMVNVGRDSSVAYREGTGIIYHYTDESGSTQQVEYETYVDCTGQPQIDFEDFPFRGLVNSGVLSQAKLAFRDENVANSHYKDHPDDIETDSKGTKYLKVSGIAVNDFFQVIEKSGVANNALYMMAVPYMGGYNPDYSGLDFAEEASERILNQMVAEHQAFFLKNDLPAKDAKVLDNVA